MKIARVLAALAVPILVILGCKPRYPIDDHLNRFRDVENLQSQLLKSLRFTYSPIQLKQYSTYKIVLRDQLGEDWLFKAGKLAGIDGAVSIYRLYLLTGVETPETHYATFNINGESVSGSLQRFYNIHPKKKLFSYLTLNQASKEYLAKNHALSWLGLNYHVYHRNFILLAQPLPGGLDILRVDNSVMWQFLGFDFLGTNYVSPRIHTQTADSGYSSLWMAYLAYDLYSKAQKEGRLTADKRDQELFLAAAKRVKFDLDLGRLFNWTRFISQIPDDLYRSIFRPGVDNNFVQMANGSEAINWMMSAEYLYQAETDQFLNKLVKRKNDAEKDFRKFYGYLADLKDQNYDFDDLKYLQELKGELDAFFEYRKSQVTERVKRVKELPLTDQKPIEAEISFSVYQTMFPMNSLQYIADPGERLATIDRVIMGLTEIKNKSSNENERSAIGNAISNLDGLKSFVNASRNWRESYSLIVDYALLFERDALKTLAKRLNRKNPVVK